MQSKLFAILLIHLKTIVGHYFSVCNNRDKKIKLVFRQFDWQK